MPELPDVTIYLEALEPRILGRTLERVQIAGPSLLRTADPPIASVEKRTVTALRRIGKRIAAGFDNDVWLVIHLMIAGRLHWSGKPKKPDGRRTLAALQFDQGCSDVDRGRIAEAGLAPRRSRRAGVAGA